MKSQEKMIEKWQRLFKEVESEFLTKLKRVFKKYRNKSREHTANAARGLAQDDFKGHVFDQKKSSRRNSLQKAVKRRQVGWDKSKCIDKKEDKKSTFCAEECENQNNIELALESKEKTSNSCGVTDGSKMASIAMATIPPSGDFLIDTEISEKVTKPKEAKRYVIEQDSYKKGSEEKGHEEATGSSVSISKANFRVVPKNIDTSSGAASGESQEGPGSKEDVQIDRTEERDEENRRLNLALLELKSQVKRSVSMQESEVEKPVPTIFKEKNLYKAAVMNNLRKSPFRSQKFNPNFYKSRTQIPTIDSEDEIGMDLGFSVPLWAKNPRLNERVVMQSHEELSGYFKNTEPINVHKIFPDVKNVTNDSPNKWENGGK